MCCRWSVDIWVFRQVLPTRPVHHAGRNHTVSHCCAATSFTNTASKFCQNALCRHAIGKCWSFLHIHFDMLFLLYDSVCWAARKKNLRKMWQYPKDIPMGMWPNVSHGDHRKIDQWKIKDKCVHVFLSLCDSTLNTRLSSCTVAFVNTTANGVLASEGWWEAWQPFPKVTSNY